MPDGQRAVLHIDFMAAPEDEPLVLHVVLYVPKGAFHVGGAVAPHLSAALRFEQFLGFCLVCLPLLAVHYPSFLCPAFFALGDKGAVFATLAFIEADVFFIPVFTGALRLSPERQGAPLGAGVGVGLGVIIPVFSPEGFLGQFPARLLVNPRCQRAPIRPTATTPA